ncbi:hypothetical protein [Rhodanobacter sp. L36]|uniref:hypothetical protein n=1 Tax=Rhodanobacter sp. L36 TaxID=1747221 RepID=UPI00131B41F3|nr:hypothetical protein [Rhodanobacter sp. L36]
MKTEDKPTFFPFVEKCEEHGISRTAAYRLVDKGLLETFTLGRRRYVVAESLRTLPERMRQQAAA